MTSPNGCQESCLLLGVLTASKLEHQLHNDVADLVAIMKLPVIYIQLRAISSFRCSLVPVPE